MISSFLVSIVCANASQNITINGAKRISEETIRSYIKDTHDPNEMTKKLFATGYFEDVTVTHEQSQLIVTVKERDIISRVVFEGNKAIKDETLKETVKIKPGSPLSKPMLQEVTGELLELYHRMGKYEIDIQPKIIRRSENTVDLVFEIKENETKNIEKIIFQGNKAIASSDLEECITSRRNKWYIFFASDDVLDEERFLQDQHLLKKFYLNHGYLDFRLIRASSEYNAQEGGFILLFHVEEGKPYTLKKSKIQSSIPSLKVKGLQSAIHLSEGDVVDARLIEETVQNIEERLIQQGYRFIHVEPKIEKKNQEAVIIFEIQEGPRSYIKRIRIKGNHHTHDTVIRREIPIDEGDAYSHTKIRKADNNLKDLGFFKNVRLDTHPDDSLTDILVDVEEQATGEIMLGGGFSTLDGPLGNIRLIERNFRGTGRILSSELSIAKKRQDFDIGLTDPYLFGKRIVGSSNLFHTRSTRFDAFTYQTQGFNLGISYHLSDHWIQGWTYGFSSEYIKKSCLDFSPVVQREQGRYHVSYLAHRISYDRRDSTLKPQKGYVASLQTSYAGLGGNIRYVRNELSSSFYCPLSENVLLVFNPRLGRMDKVRNKRLRIVDRFNMGLGTFRGFDYSGVGPRYMRSYKGKNIDDPLGGERYAVLSTDLEFPIGLPNDFGVKGTVFSDVGTVWCAGFKDPHIIDKKTLRTSVGIGLKWNSPFGPLKFEYAWAVKKSKGDDQRRFIFGYTTPM